MEEQSVNVSVIIPVYNVAAFIERCADSLFQQTLTEVEYIFVDDASPDNSVKLVEQCLERYPERRGQVRILRHEHNQGAQPRIASDSQYGAKGGQG